MTEGRAVAEWIGKTPDTAIPPRVRIRLFQRASGRCQQCTRAIRVGEVWNADHVKALANGGEHREGNLRVLCDWCHKMKTRADVAEKALVYRTRKKFLGQTKPRGRPLPGTKASGWRKRMNGTIERR